MARTKRAETCSRSSTRGAAGSAAAADLGRGLLRYAGGGNRAGAIVAARGSRPTLGAASGSARKSLQKCSDFCATASDAERLCERAGGTPLDVFTPAHDDATGQAQARRHVSERRPAYDG